MMNVSTELEQYILDHSTHDDPLLNELFRQTHVKIYHPRQVSGPVQGKILELLVRMIKPNQILEIGTFTGYSALCMARGLEQGGKLHTIEINDELEQFASSYIRRSEHRSKIIQHIGDATEIIPTLNLPFDLVFIDGNKSQYNTYYDLVFDKVSAGGFIIADNVLWDGKVVGSNLKENDYFTKGIIDFNTRIRNDQRVEQVIFPVRDGMMIIRKLV